jgi:Tfp pilus assembly protein PilF
MTELNRMHPHPRAAARSPRGLLRRATILGLLLTLAALLGLSACGGKEPRQAVGRLDTPEHHVRRGNDFLMKDNYAAAEESFDQALSLKRDHGPALAGKAVVTAYAAGQGGKERGKKIEQAEDYFHDAVKRAANDDEKRVAYVAGIRVQQLAKPGNDWVDKAADYYDDAVDLDERNNDPAPHFYMARAYRDAFQMQNASRLYKQVLELNRGLVGEADAELAVVQKIERAAPGTLHGRVVAFEPSISRADVAGLFVEELKLPELYERGNQARFDTRFKAPQQNTFQADVLQKAPEMTDVSDHPLRADIMEVVRLRVAGLQPDAAHKYHPDAKLTRGEFAIMVEDILVRVTGEQGLKTKFIGQPSPFADVRNDLHYFNAVQTVTTRSLMEPKNKLQGVFGPTEPLTGADALLVIRLLKNELKSYIRS